MNQSPQADKITNAPVSRRRADAVTRLLAGDDIDAIAVELQISRQEVEQWTKEFCRAGEMRLRQLPDNWPERLVTSAEKLVPLATLVSVLLAVTLFIQGQRKEAAEHARVEVQARESRVRDAYTALDDRYLDYVKQCLDHPDLDVFDTPLVRTIPPSVDQQRRESMMLSMLLSILERAYLMYNTPDDAFERNQWAAWSSYMQAWSTRANFRKEWTNSKNEFDQSFAVYMDSLINTTAGSAPATAIKP